VAEVSQEAERESQETEVQPVLGVEHVLLQLLPYVTKDTKGIPGSGYELVNSLGTSLLTSMKNKYVKEQISKLPEGSSKGIKVKRAAAQRFADQGKCDHNGEFMIFGQIYQRTRRMTLSRMLLG